MTEVQALLNGMTALIAALTQKEEGGQGASGGGMKPHRLNPNHMKLEAFDGKMENWGDWAFSIKRVVRAQSLAAYNLMVKAEAEKEEIDDELDLSDEDVKISAELYDILCQYCKGEALTLMRNIDDCQGARAWQRLHKKYNPKTIARMIRLLGEVTTPPKITDHKSVKAAVNKWEHKVGLLEKEFSEGFSEPMKIAIMVNAMPRGIQEQVYASLAEGATYRDTITKIKTIAGNHAAMETMKPIPMDIGEVYENSNEYYEEDEVGAVGMHMQCRMCSGWGHLQRECPSRPWEA